MFVSSLSPSTFSFSCALPLSLPLLLRPYALERALHARTRLLGHMGGREPTGSGNTSTIFLSAFALSSGLLHLSGPQIFRLLFFPLLFLLYTSSWSVGTSFSFADAIVTISQGKPTVCRSFISGLSFILSPT